MWRRCVRLAAATGPDAGGDRGRRGGYAGEPNAGLGGGYPLSPGMPFADAPIQIALLFMSPPSL